MSSSVSGSLTFADRLNGSHPSPESLAQNPVNKNGLNPRTMLTKNSEGGDPQLFMARGLSLTNLTIYPGFDCGSPVKVGYGSPKGVPVGLSGTPKPNCKQNDPPTTRHPIVDATIPQTFPPAEVLPRWISSRLIEWIQLTETRACSTYFLAGGGGAGGRGQSAGGVKQELRICRSPVGRRTKK